MSRITFRKRFVHAIVKDREPQSKDQPDRNDLSGTRENRRSRQKLAELTRAKQTRARRQRVGDLLRIAGVAVHLLADDLQRHLVQIGLQVGVEIGKFAPKHLVDEAARSAHHDRGAPLPVITIRHDPVAAAKRHEQVARPWVGYGELHLDRVVLPLQLGELRPHALERCFGGAPLAGGGPAREQRFDLAELVAQLRVRGHGVVQLTEPQQRLYFLPEPHEHGSLLPTLPRRGSGAGWLAASRMRASWRRRRIVRGMTAA